MARAMIRLARLARRFAARAQFELALEMVALRFGVSGAELRRRCLRRPGMVNIRRQALYLAVMSGHSRRAIADATGLSAEAVARACRVIEDARDDPELDRALDELELDAIGS